MGGGLLELIAYGAQDAYLTHNPQITFWKSVYRRYTNFSVESIEQTFSGDADFGKRVSCTIARNGDLISQIFLEVQLPALSAGYVEMAGGFSDLDSLSYVNSIGHALIKSVDVEVGGQRIDRHYGTWLEIWNELTIDAEKEAGFNQMIGKHDADIGLVNSANIDRIYVIPLNFWFNRIPGLALPLIALQFHEVKINIEFRPVMECLVGLTGPGARTSDGTGGIPGNGITLSSDGRANIHFKYAQLYVDYVYLDTEERKRFSEQEHRYLIEQLQHNGSETISLKPNMQESRKMNFNHPTKEIVWVFQRGVNAPSNGGNIASNDWFNFSTSDPGTVEPAPYTGDIMSTDRQACKIQLNSHDRFSPRPALYFRLVQPYKHHTRIPSKHVYMYSHALRPEDHQPSGTCNYSRIENAMLWFRLSNNEACDPVSHAASDYGDVFSDSATGTLSVFAVNVNVFHITSGMGGLAYAS